MLQNHITVSFTKRAQARVPERVSARYITPLSAILEPEISRLLPKSHLGKQRPRSQINYTRATNDKGSDDLSTGLLLTLSRRERYILTKFQHIV